MPKMTPNSLLIPIHQARPGTIGLLYAEAMSPLFKTEAGASVAMGAIGNGNTAGCWVYDPNVGPSQFWPDFKAPYSPDFAFTHFMHLPQMMEEAPPESMDWDEVAELKVGAKVRLTGKVDAFFPDKGQTQLADEAVGVVSWVKEYEPVKIGVEFEQDGESAIVEFWQTYLGEPGNDRTDFPFVAVEG